MKRLVILRALGLADLLTAFPALRGLALGFPDHRRILAAPKSLEWLARTSGAVDEVVDAREAAALPTELHDADVAVNLHGPQSDAVMSGARPRRLIAFGDEVSWREDEHDVQRWCRLLAAHGIAADPDDLDVDVDLGRLPQVPGNASGATLIHAGAGSAARRWPVDRWAAVARAELEAGRSVVLSGAGREISITVEIVRQAGLERRANFTGRTGLRGLTALVAAAGRVVCGDTGVAHLATALRTPSVVLFGPVGPDRWGPPPDRAWHRALWAGEPDPGLLAIDAAQVRQALADLPTRESDRRERRKEPHALG